MILWKQIDEQLQSQPIDGPADLDVAAADSDRQRPTPRILPVAAEHGVVAALCTPMTGSVSRNGMPLGPGMHLLQHTDRLEVEGRCFWVSGSTSLESTQYDPARHGEDVYCFVTKARLQAGDEIIECPGAPGKPCGLIYKRSAWEMAVEADAKFRCPRCKFDPRAGEWAPTIETPHSLQPLFDLARQHAGRTA